VVLGAALLLLAVLLRRADLVVLAAPLLLGAGLGLAARPLAGPTVRLRVPADALLEGGRATVLATVEAPDGMDVAAVELVLPAGLAAAPESAAVHIPPADPGGDGSAQAGAAVRPAAANGVATAKANGAARANGAPNPTGGAVEVEFRIRATRWGRRQAGPAILRATAGYGMLSWPPVRTGTSTVTTWPLREGFGASDTVPRAEGLVGGHVSRRPGEGGDLAGVRPFAPGDRLRRINWRVTGRTGELHVTATYSDRDTEVLLVLDSAQDLGRLPDSSLDIGVRAAASIAEHYLRAGDRVGLVDLGSPQRRVPSRNGRNHLVRLLDVLMDAHPRPDQRGAGRPTDAATFGSPDALVVLLSPLTNPAALAAVAGVARSGRSVVAVDTLPPELHPDQRSDWTPLAFRIWRLRRGADLDRLAELGVPVVAWGGAGSLDAVLRDARRAARAAR
jgi:uncharacterized protein (DUF58 family)